MRTSFSLVLVTWMTIALDYCDGFLPSSIPRCPRTSPDPSKCIINAVETLRGNLASGDFGGGFKIPKLEPLQLTGLRFYRGPDVNCVFDNIQVRGASNFVVEKLKANVDDITFDFIVFLPKLDFKGKYNLKVKVSIFDLSGQGDVKGSFYRSRARVRLRGYKENVNGVDYVRFRKLQVRLRVDDAKFQLDNLFNGDPTLGEIGNAVVNANVRLILDELTPTFEENLVTIFTDLANNILKDVTYDEMFPPQ